MKFTLLITMLLAIACSKNANTGSAPDQYGGKDLYSELSQQEKMLLGTWYFSYEIFNLKNGTDSISTEPLIIYTYDATDTLRFLSTQFVGTNIYCPFIAPDSLKDSLKTAHCFTGYLLNCLPDYISGWFIRNNMIVNYSGLFDSNMQPYMNYLPIEKLTDDSLIFIYPEHLDSDSLKTYFNRKPVYNKL
jgi:hypothetical protein